MEAGSYQLGEFWVGVDLGARVDRSAIVVVEALQVHTTIVSGEPIGERTLYKDGRTWTEPVYAEDSERHEDVFEVAQINRLDQGAPHSETLAALVDVYARYRPRFCLFDDTGLGVGFHEYVRSAINAGQLPGRRPEGVTLTAQTKYEVTTALDRLVDEQRIRVPDIPGAEKLRQEMRDFHYRYTAAGNVSTGSVTAAAHDDLVIATALAVYPTWWRQRPLARSYVGAPITRPCRVVNRTINVPNPEETP